MSWEEVQLLLLSRNTWVFWFVSFHCVKPPCHTFKLSENRSLTKKKNSPDEVNNTHACMNYKLLFPSIENAQHIVIHHGGKQEDVKGHYCQVLNVVAFHSQNA
jgi:hypothetical protein